MSKFYIGMIAACLCVIFLSCGTVEAATLPVAAAKIAPIVPMVDIVGWVLLFVVTIFL
jgi:hypothetical protein